MLLDDPDVAIYTSVLGKRYMVHLFPVVLRELDDKKLAGRTPDLRDAAKKADSRLKGLRTNGNVLRGVRVAGDVHAIFEHIEPKGDTLPNWLDLDVPDDRFVASTLLLQSRHPGSAVYVATRDINLQTKLAAVGLPFFEAPLWKWVAPVRGTGATHGGGIRDQLRRVSAAGSTGESAGRAGVQGDRRHRGRCRGPLYGRESAGDGGAAVHELPQPGPGCSCRPGVVWPGRGSSMVLIGGPMPGPGVCRPLCRRKAARPADTRTGGEVWPEIRWRAGGSQCR
ncbi:PIN domain-containing protein [Streptomyces badius]